MENNHIRIGYIDGSKQVSNFLIINFFGIKCEKFFERISVISEAIQDAKDL